MDAAELRAEVDRGLVQVRWRTLLQIAFCVGSVAWAAMLLRPLQALVLSSPPFAFAVAVTLGREQYIRRAAAEAGTSNATLIAFYRRYVEELLRKRRRLRFAGPIWVATIWLAIRFSQFDVPPPMRTGLFALCAVLLGVSANAAVSVPRLAALRARLEFDRP